LKPAFDAYRVATGHEKDPLQTSDPEIEMGFSRGIEIVFESLPSGIMQIYAFLLSRERDKWAMCSIVISMMCTAFAGTVMSWDLDTSPIRRKTNPEFYGYIKNDPTSRTLTFVVMMTITFCHVLMKSLSTALLMSMSVTWLAAYLIGDMLLFMLYKILRCDFRHWLNLGDPLSLIMSFFFRFAAKLLIDYTLCFQFRHCYEAGGRLFCIMVVQSQAACFAISYYYLYHYDGGGGVEGLVATYSTSFNTTDLFLTKNSSNIISFTNNTNHAVPKIGSNALWSILFCLLGLLVVNIGVFFTLIDSKYLGTFTTTDTGPQLAVNNYYAAKTDEEKIDIFSNHPYYYSLIDSELMKWVHKNWSKWKSDQPYWFTADVISSIPDKFIPVEEVRRMDRESGVGQRRKSSVADAFGLGGGGKARASVVPLFIA